MANVRYPTLTPGTAHQDVNPREKLGVVFQVTEATTIQGIYFYSPISYPDRSFELYVGGVNVSTVASDVVQGDNFVPFSSPLAASPGTDYTMVVGEYGPADGTTMNYTFTPFTGGTYGPFVFPNPPGRYVDHGDTTVTTPPSDSSSNWYGVGPYIADEVAPTPIQVSAVASDTSVTEGETVTLTATAVDNTGSVDYEWTQVAGTNTAITNAATSVATVTPATAGSYTFRVTATDDTDTDTADVTITVTTEPVEPTTPPTLWIKDDEGNWFQIGGTSQSAKPGVFRLADFGAVGDGVTDDTDAWNACIEAAIEAAPEHNYSVVVECNSSEYLIATPAVEGRNYGNSQISIPHVPASTSPKITLTFRGQSISSTFLHWEQEEPHSLGTVLHSTYSSGSYDNTWGVPSILGGPTNLSTAPQDQFATFSNVHVVLEGISTLQPWGASLIGFDFRRMAQAHVVSASTFSDRTRKTTPGIETLTTNDQSVGLVMPYKGNNARSEIGSYTSEGLHTALIAGEHLVAAYIGVIYCRRGVEIVGLTGGNWPDGQPRIADHSIYIGRYLAEAVDYWIYNESTGTQLVISSMGGEGTTNFVAHVHDEINGENGRGGLTGEIRLLDIFQQFPVVEGAGNLRIINDGATRGLTYTTPAIPATGVELLNPFWRDATVVIDGGTVSAIEVDGTDQAVTGGPIFVPTGSEIAVEYSVAPTWTWMLH